MIPRSVIMLDLLVQGEIDDLLFRPLLCPKSFPIMVQLRQACFFIADGTALPYVTVLQFPCKNKGYDIGFDSHLVVKF